MMQIDLPRRLNRDTMYALLKKVITKDRLPISNELVLNFSTLTVFIEPCGVTILSNLIHWLEYSGVNVYILADEDSSGIENPIKFLDDSMFFKEHLGEKLINTSQVRKTTLPLRQVNAENPMDWLINEFTPWLSRQLLVPIERLATIQVCIEEILNNIRDHADKKTGCIFAQYTPRNHEVVISISDFGVGIPFNVQNKHPSLTETEAILKAVERGFSTRSQPHNRGFGLDNLIHNVVINGKGSVHIHSLTGILSCYNGQNEIQYKSRMAFGFYPGTLIDLVFKTDVDDIFDIEEEDFQWDDW
jgi:anti-sigma regulatory factor (Ser/Thr protein kinase)